MAVFFLVLAVIVGVVITDAVVANTAAGSIQLFDQTITRFTQGQLMAIAAAAGFIFVILLLLTFSASRSGRARRKERRLAQRELQGRLGELEQENSELRSGTDRDRRTNRLGDMGTPATEETRETTQSRRLFPSRRQDRPDRTTVNSAERQDMFNQADR